MRLKGLLPPRSDFRVILIPGALVLLWSLAQLARDPRFFWTDDFQAQASPFFEEIVRSWREGEWPLLARNSWCTGNLAGEYQYGTFSPSVTALLMVVWSFPLSLPAKAAAVAIVHLVWLATGVFVLGRLRGLTVPLATATALAASLSGWVIGWAATNWISFVIGFSWVPWVWWAFQTALASASVWKRWLRPGLCVALLITAGNTFATMMVPMVAGWLVLQAIIRDRDWRAPGPIAAAGLLGAGLSAPAWWLLLEAATFSPRWGWGMAIQRAWIVPWRAWVGLVLPSFVTPWPYYSSEYFRHASLELACGLVPAAALAAAVLFQPVATLRKLRWELIFLVFCILLVSLPSLGQFRWSFRWLPLFHLVLALTAASALQQGLAARAAICGVGLTAAAWAGTALFGENRSPVLSAWLLGLSAAWWLAQRFAPRAWADWLPAAVVALTLGATFWFLPTHDASYQAKFAFDDTILSPAPLDRDRLYLSLYSFNEIVHAEDRPRGTGSIVRPVNAMHYAGLRFLNGYSSYSGHEVQSLFDTHGDIQPAKAESLTGPDGERLLLFLGVDGIVLSAEYAHFARTLGPEWRKVAEAPEGVAYHREPPRFQAVKTLTFLFDRPGVPLADPVVELIAERRNSVTARITPLTTITEMTLGADEARRAVAPIAFVRPFLPGYEAALNGAPVPVRSYRGMLPIVELPADAGGILELRYRPRGLTHGLVLTAVSALAMLLIAAFGRKRRAT
jgi:hypothetical protein